MDHIKNTIKSFLSKFTNIANVKDTDDIFNLGFTNSLFSIQLVMFLEKEFSITIENSDLNLQNFSSVNSIEQFVAAKLLSGKI